ncbi:MULTISPECIES: hypothetical protein [Bacillus cereus group]|uniref:Uncharacterized protein n=1 Tax=Bacillus cereus VD184 TaxID=1053242 RepID=A0A9W5RBX3_BACCE|nr:hypothetical protein [Bacillus cereus]EOQ19736.1 hypothetical protein IKC_04210 [Bacillus cereus VD184]
MPISLFGKWYPNGHIEPQWMTKLDSCSSSLFYQLDVPKEKVVEILQSLHDLGIID